MNKSIIIGLSGGVDSSVAALLLKQQGWNVIGLTAILDRNCQNANYSSITNSANAKVLCEFLQIPHYELDFSEVFEIVIVDNFYYDYINGFTPNPCVICNKRIKWSAFLHLANQLKCQYFATGHYARGMIIDNYWYLLKGIDINKDQSYFLCHVPYELLQRTVFPLGDLTKSEVKKIAIENNLPINTNQESNDICFLRLFKNRTEFFKNKYQYTPNPITVIDANNNIYKCQRSIEEITYGQRAPVPLPGQPVNYVWKIDAKNHQVYVAPKGFNCVKTIEAENFNFTTNKSISENKKYLVKTRYRQKGRFAFLKQNDKNLMINFEQPTEFVAPGQWAVVYDGDIVIGGGKITDKHIID